MAIPETTVSILPALLLLSACQSTGAPAPTTSSAPTPAPPPVAAPAPAPVPSPAAIERLPGADDGLSAERHTLVQKAPGCAEADTCASVSLSWVHLSGGSAAAVHTMNTWIEADMLAGLDTETRHPSAETVAASFFQAVDACVADDIGMVCAWDLERSAQWVWSSDRLVSLSLVESSYTGGAHPNHHALYATFDRKTGARIALGDILVEGAEAALQPLIRASLEETFQEPLESILLSEDAGGVVPLAAGWTLSDDVLRLEYNPYEITAYVYGAPSVALPRSAIAAWIRPDSPW